MMKDDINILKSKFEKIKKLGWIKADKLNCATIGITFEKMMGIPTNELEIPDFRGIEIKTKCKGKFKYISLFNCVPTGPHYHEVERIKEQYGYPDTKLKNFKIFNGDIFCNKINKIGNKYYFKLNVHKNTNKITLIVYARDRKMIEECTYWDFDIIREKLIRKLSYLALVEVNKKKIYNSIYFKYNTLCLYKLKDFNTFIYLIEKGLIKITFKTGIYRAGKRIGKTHDRGVSFSIDQENITELFDYIEQC